MKKILCFGWGISILVIAVLCIYIVRCEPKCNKVHVDDIVTEGRSIIPDEETAKEMAYILVEANLGFEESGFYESRVKFNEKTNEWEILFYEMTFEGQYVLGSGKVVCINKDSGTVTALYCELK